MRGSLSSGKKEMRRFRCSGLESCGGRGGSKRINCQTRVVCLQEFKQLTRRGEGRAAQEERLY